MSILIISAVGLFWDYSGLAGAIGRAGSAHSGDPAPGLWQPSYPLLIECGCKWTTTKVSRGNIVDNEPDTGDGTGRNYLGGDRS